MAEKEGGSTLPTSLEKREYLYGKGAPPQTLVKIGESYREAGQLEEAALFFNQAGDTARLEKMCEEAVEAGDYFLYEHINKCLGRPADEKELSRLAERARELGKESFARWAEGKGAGGEPDAGEPA